MSTADPITSAATEPGITAVDCSAKPASLLYKRMHLMKLREGH